MWKYAWIRRGMFCLHHNGMTLTEGWHFVWMAQMVSAATQITCWERKPLKGDTSGGWATRWCRTMHCLRGPRKINISSKVLSQFCRATIKSVCVRVLCVNDLHNARAKR